MTQDKKKAILDSVKEHGVRFINLQFSDIVGMV